MKLNNISSLNLRLGRAGGKKLKDPIKFMCACGKENNLGKDGFVMVKIDYHCGDDASEVMLCDECCDKFIDYIRFGPRVSEEDWVGRSRVARVSRIVGDFKCYKCLGREDTHLFVKYDDLSVEGRKEAYMTVRVCARCAISYLYMVLPKKQVVVQ